MTEKKQRGGARPNSGPKPLRDKPNRKTLKLSDQTLEALLYYSKYTGINPSDLADNVLFLYLNDTDFVICPECKKPTYFKPILPVNGECDFVCINCKHEFKAEI